MFGDLSTTAKCVITAGAGATIILMLRRLVFGKTVWCSNRAMLNGKTVVITGANTGIGKATAVELAKRGARVILACRDIRRGLKAAIQVRELSKNSDVEVKRLDLASLSSVRDFAKDVSQQEERIDVLINNAGVFQCPFSKTEDGFETHFAVNYLGHFLLTQLLLPKLQSSKPSRIIIVSSALYTKGSIEFDNLNGQKRYDRALAYSNSKLAGLLHMHELARRLPEGVTVNAMHPGVVWTELGRHIVTGIFKRLLYPLLAYLFLKSPIEGAQTVIHLATEPSLETTSGKYFGNCKEEDVLPKAKDDDVAKRLWNLSQQMTNAI